MVRASLVLVAIILSSIPAFADGSADADAGIARLASSDARAAVDLFTRAIQSKDLSQENLALTYHRRGMAFYMEGEAGRAILDYTIALWHEDLPKEFRPRTLNNRGLAFEAINDYETAIRDYGLSIRLNPNYPEPYCNRANLHRKFNRHKEAIDDYEMALRFGHPHPKFVFAWEGLSLEAMGKRREAADLYKRALEMDPSFELAKTRLLKIEDARALNGVISRRTSSKGMGGPLLSTRMSGSPSQVDALAPIERGPNIGEIPWAPPPVKGPAIIKVQAPVEEPATEFGLRPAFADAPRSVPSGTQLTPDAPAAGPSITGTGVVSEPEPVKPASVAPLSSVRPPPRQEANGEGGSDSEFVIQLGSFNSEALARVGWSKASRAAKDLVNGMTHSIEAVEIAGKGRMFRLYAGALPDQQSALNLCRTLRDKGSACIVVKR